MWMSKKSSNRSRISSVWLQQGLRGMQHVQLSNRAQKETVLLDRRRQAGHLCNCDPGWHWPLSYHQSSPLSPAADSQKVRVRLARSTMFDTRSPSRQNKSTNPSLLYHNWPAVLQIKVKLIAQTRQNSKEQPFPHAQWTSHRHLRCTEQESDIDTMDKRQKK